MFFRCRTRSVNNTSWPSSYTVNLDRLPYNKAITNSEDGSNHDSHEDLVSISLEKHRFT